MKKGVLRIGIAAAVLSVALLGCQSVKPVTVENSILTEQTGLAPNGDKQHSSIDFSLVVANQNALINWKVEMVSKGVSQRQWNGKANNFPTTLTWDGLGTTGAAAPEGTYAGTLTVDYGMGNPVTAQSSNFILDVAPPIGSVTSNPAQFTSNADGVAQPVTISVTGSSAIARMDSWSLDILDKHGKVFRSFDGKGQSSEFTWDGKSTTGEWVTPSQSYIAEATLRDEFGNATQIYSTISVSDLPQPVQRAAAPQTFSITAGSGGFSPKGERASGAMFLALSYGPLESVSSWKVEILDSQKTAQKTFNVIGSAPPATVSWNGKSDSGIMAPEGTYTARLSVEYGSAFKPGSTTSAPFVLDLTPPTGSVTLSDLLFSPIEGSPTITLTVDAKSTVARIDSWRMEIYDPENHLFRTFEAKWPSKSAIWDGKGFNKDSVLSAEDYPVVVKVRDEFGNVGELKSSVPVDILVERTATGFRILSSRIFFKAYTADYTDVRPELAKLNVKRLTDMTAVLKRFPNYRIRLVGHAVMEYWDNTAQGTIEQRDVLLPLSKARAEAVKTALVANGLQSSMFTTEGVGASDQLVLDSNLADRWQNRRVAFFIDRE